MLHFEPGAPATNYRFRGALTVNHSPSGVYATISTGRTITRFGNPFPLSGFEQSIRVQWDPVSMTFGRSVSLVSPILGLNLTRASSATVPASRVEIDGAVMTATNCEAWRLTFDELRWYVDGVEILDRFGRSVLDASLGPYTVSGIDYRQGENQTRLVTRGELSPEIPHGATPCGQQASYSVYLLAESSYEGGWGWWDGSAWQAEAITIDSLSPPAPVWPGGCAGSCTCIEGLPIVSEVDAYTVTVTAREEYTFTSTFMGMQQCTCPAGSIVGSINVERYRYEKDLISAWSAVDAIAESDPLLRRSRRYTGAICSCHYPLVNDDWTYTDTTSTDGIAYAGQRRDVIRTKSMRECGYGLIACTSPEGSILQPLCLFATPTLCAYGGFVQQTPVETCACTQADPSVTHTDDGQWVSAFVCDDAIYTAYSDQRRDDVTGLAFTATDTGLEGSSPAIGVYTYSLGEEWVLVYRSLGGAIVYSTSRDWGSTWSMATTIAASGAHPRIHITSDNRRYVTYLSGTDIRCKLYDGAMNLVEDIGIIQGSVDADSRHDLSSYSGGQGEWVMLLTYVAGGAIVAKTSHDGKVYS